jgi:hypothetical protein
MPELVKWVNGYRYDGGRLSPEQRALRTFYGRLLKLSREPAFAAGEFLPLNGANRDNPQFGRLPGETASGHWLYAFLRHDPASGQVFLVVANLHGKSALRDVRIRFSPAALAALGFMPANGPVEFRDRLAATLALRVRTTGATLREEGLVVAELPPLGAWYFEVLRPAR